MSKKFIINVDTGNIEQDVFSTISNFSEEQMKEFIESIKLKKDINGNISGELLIFRYPDCEKIILTTKDVTKLPIDIKKLIIRRTYRINADEFLTMNFEILKDKDIRIKFIFNRIYSVLNKKRIFIDVISNDRYDSNFYELCFEIISSDDLFNKFLHYDENIEIFGKNFTQEDYVFELSKILGYAELDICKENPIYKYNFITQDMLDRYLSLRKVINVDIRMLGENPFNQGGRTSYSRERQYKIDNDWEVNPHLISYVMKDMDSQYTVLEKISHIYIKLCEVLRYNLGYHIKKWGTQYNKNRQESISPQNNEVICSEFSMICTNIINKLDNNVEARCIIAGKEQHISFGILDRDKNIRINFDSTHFAIGDDKFDDLGRIKLGLPLIGVEYVRDRNDEFKNSFERVYNKFCNGRQIETEDLIAAYEMLPSNKTISINFHENISEFLRMMKIRNIVGSELLGVFKKLYQIGYFGDIVYSIVGEDKKLTFDERNKMETPEELLDGLEENIIIDNGGEYYLLQLNQCEIVKMSSDELNWLFEVGKMRYFNLEHQIEGIGVKKCTKA